MSLNAVLPPLLFPMPLDEYFKSTAKPKQKKRSAYILMKKKMKQLREDKPEPKVPWNSRTLDF